MPSKYLPLQHALMPPIYLMQIRFKNLGQINDTVLDLRPLTIIIGPNNSNKTYVAYCIHGLLKELRRLQITAGDLLPLTRGDDAWTTRLDTSLCNRLRAHIKTSVKAFQDDITTYFGDTSSKLFVASEFNIKLSNAEIIRRAKALPVVDQYEMGEGLLYKVSCEGNTIVIRKANSEKTTVLQAQHNMPSSLASWMMLNWLVRATISNPFLLPAERNAFVITYKTLIGGRNKEMVATRQVRKAADPAQPVLFDGEVSFRYPRPVEEFLQFLYDAEEQKMPTQGQSFAYIADYIEKHLQNANRTHYRSARQGNELAVAITPDLTIDLYNASSSIKQLAPLLIYLRQRARLNDLIIIDEPEMNLHPESQAKLLEALAILVNAGVNVLLTTHSPYVMQHLNNLVMDRRTDIKERPKLAEALYLRDAQALLNPSQVSAYEMSDHKLVSLADPNYGIRWDTLSNVSLDLQEKYFHLTDPS